MGRAPRIDEPGVTYHVIFRCNHDAWLLQAPEAKRRFLDRLDAAVQKHELVLYAYVVMDSHAHLVLSRSRSHLLSVAMHWLMTQSAKDELRAAGRKGHFWQQRFRAIPVEDNEYAIALLRYLDRNPVRAGVADSAPDYAWSSCRAYACGITIPRITLHPTYLGLSRYARVREAKYRGLLDAVLPDGDRRQPAFSQARALGRLPFRDRFGATHRPERFDLASLLVQVRHLSHPKSTSGAAGAVTHPVPRASRPDGG